MTFYEMISQLQKEICGACKKFINIGQSLLECETCFTAIHTKCYKKAGFSSIHGSWACDQCTDVTSLRYNPYKSYDGHSENFYDDEGAYDDTVIQQICRVLDSCKSYTVHDLNELTSCNTTSSQEPDIEVSQFSTYFVNIDGNKSNFENLNIELKRTLHKFSVIGIAETNTCPELQNLYKMEGYTEFYQSVIEGKHKGTGVALYIDEQFNSEILDEASICTNDLESLFIKLSRPSCSEALVVGVIYRPPNGDPKAFLDKFRDICALLPESGARVMGDFNIDFFQMHNNTNLASQFEDLIISHGLSPAISIPTHQRSNCRPTCIDNILTNDIDKVIHSGTLSDSIGDHLPVFELSTIYFAKPAVEKHIKYYDYSNKNLENFTQNLSEKLADHQVSHDFVNFVNIFSEALDDTCKLERPKVTKRTRMNNPWITDGLIAAIDRKHELKHDWIKSINKHNPLGDQVLRKVFTDYRSALSPIIKQAKNSFNCDKILESKHDRKKTWKIINDLRGKTKACIKPSFVIDNVKITNRRVISNEFNKYFNSIASKLNDSLPNIPLSNSTIPSFMDFLAPANNNTMYLEDCTSDELLDIISDFDNNKASDIPIRIIKKASHIITPTLSKYFNVLMKDGIFPDILKIGKITPIFKKGSPEDMGNYRPVSTLPIFGKLFEKIIYSRIYSFAQTQGIINPNQFGFRKSHSTSHAVNQSVKIIEDTLKANKHILGIFIDLSKAFDTIDHRTLLTKLERYGIRGNTHDLIKSYLSRRQQYTEVLGEKSECLTVEYGVPQGSVLGPLLFILYINDISRSSKLGTFIMFADDTNLFVEGSTKEEVYNKGNEVLKSIHSYMLSNKLHINMSKCCYIHFRPNTRNPDTDETVHNLFIENFPIKKVSETRFLGVIIDEQLSWEPHLTALRRKLGFAASTLYKIRDNVPIYLRKELYHTLYESHLTYCISVWGGVPLSKTSRIWTSQKHCLSILFGDKEAFLDKFCTCARARPRENQLLGENFYRREHTKPLFNQFSILTLKNLYTYHMYMELFKILKLRDPITVFEQFTISKRKSTLLICNTPANNFVSRSTKIWNIITPKLKLCDFSCKISIIKSKLKSALLKLQKGNDPITWTAEDFSTDKLDIFEIITKV